MNRTRRKCGLEIVGKNALRWGRTTSGAAAYICAACRRQWDRERKRLQKVDRIMAEVAR